MHEYPKSVRLLRPAEFRRVYDNGHKYSCALFAAFSLARETAHAPLAAPPDAEPPGQPPAQSESALAARPAKPDQTPHPPDAGSPARFGFTTPRGLGKAVARNRIRRRLRECVRLRKERFPAGLDVVFNPRRAMLAAAWTEVESQVERYIQRLNKVSTPS